VAFLDAPPPSRRRSAAAFALFAGATLAAGAPGARSSSARSAWYRATSRPRWPPPASALRPVWTTLSALAATSGWRAWRSRRPGYRRAVALWAAPLAVSAAWSPLFFGHRRRWAALAGAALLLPAVAAYAGAARRVDRLAAALVVPHLAASAFVLARRGELVPRGRLLLGRG
jgi:tryptophan-rich sensory protein